MMWRPPAWIFLLLFVAGCGGNGPQSQDSELAGLKVYRHSMGQAPTSIDPVQAANVYANYVVLNAYDTLFMYKYLARPYELKPNLAAAMPEISADNLTYTIRIKEGVHFIDDPAFPDSKDARLSPRILSTLLNGISIPRTVRRARGSGRAGSKASMNGRPAGSDYDAEIPGFRALDRYTLFIKLTRPYPQLIHTLTQGYSSIVPREAAEKYGQEFAIRPVGSGPFRVVSYDTSRIVYDRTRISEKNRSIWTSRATIRNSMHSSGARANRPGARAAVSR